jgi:hypothetical protein
LAELFIGHMRDGHAAIKMTEIVAHLDETYGPQRNHIHAVIRTPNGNDYGKDLLRQHYADHPH